jgi:hypothetical protein
METGARRTWWAVVALAAWTLFVWVGRIRNVWSDSSLDAAGKAGRSALALSFVVLAGPLLVWALRRRRTGIPAAMRHLVVALGVWTTGVWVVRSAGIWVHEHPVGFKVVHTVLAAISIALAAVAVRRVVASGAQVDVQREREAAATTTGLEELANG